MELLPIIATLLVGASLVLLIEKRRFAYLWRHLFVFLTYGVFIVIGMGGARGWDGLGWLLAGMLLFGIQVLILFISAISMEKLERPKPQEKASLRKPPQQQRSVSLQRNNRPVAEKPAAHSGSATVLDLGEDPFN